MRFASSSLFLYIESILNCSSNSSSPKAVFVMSGSLESTLIAFLRVSRVAFSDFLSSATLSGSPKDLVKDSFLLIYE